MMIQAFLHNCQALLPELALALTICVIIAADMMTALDRSKDVAAMAALLGICAAL